MVAMVTIRDEGPVSGRQQDEALLPGDDAVQVLVVVLVHWDSERISDRLAGRKHAVATATHWT